MKQVKIKDTTDKKLMRAYDRLNKKSLDTISRGTVIDMGLELLLKETK